MINTRSLAMVMAMMLMTSSVLAENYSDFNNSGNAGWIWRGLSNGLEGKIRTWEPDWGQTSGNWVVPSRRSLPDWDAAGDWSIVTTGDFDGDGDADWLWRHNTDKWWRVWHIQNGYRVLQTGPFADGFDLAHEWTVVGAGDTNNDGADEVIIYNAGTGEVQAWEGADGKVTVHTLGTWSGYDLVRIGDFDGDGDADLLMRQQGSDILRFRSIQNHASVASLNSPQTGAGFYTRCAGDFDGDGKDDDVYFTNADHSVTKWYEYENFSRIATHFGANQSVWDVIGCADFDGDGTTDIQWTSADGWGYNRMTIIGTFATESTFLTNRYGGTNAINPGYGYEYRNNRN